MVAIVRQFVRKKEQSFCSQSRGRGSVHYVKRLTKIPTHALRCAYVCGYSGRPTIEHIWHTEALDDERWLQQAAVTCKWFALKD